jgi:hypothetical protein
MTDPHDPLDGLLSPPAMPEDHALRARLRYETSQRVSRRRPIFRLARVAAAAACLAVCLLALRGVMVLLIPAADPQRPRQISLSGNLFPPGQANPAPNPEAPAPSPPSPAALEWAAFDSPAAERPARYLEAGDQYLEEAQDYAGALRCYRQAMESGDPAALEVDPDDNWLVMALKRDQRKEH